MGEIVRPGFYDPLVLIGFPYDEGAVTAGSRLGSNYGPDSFRRYLGQCGSLQNPEYGVDIVKGLPHIADYGNIQIYKEVEGRPVKATMTELYSKLATKVSLCVNRGFVPFIMGGSRDLTCAVVEAYLLAAKSDKPVTDVTFV